ncbi:hypothetical protein KFE25_000987 [Diacronema lutheri]|uniref:non-specific serine/threonine protein kinase n=2 Tax=Diacronema lutheri TaxID=2081491 RepID=A0A8J5X6T9_DIALT|nr:hypothetical protein KFE25_000987 [Diacronema lutheri]
MGAVVSSCVGAGAPPVIVGGRRLLFKAPLAEGAFSFVELRADASTGELFALKRVPLRDDDAADARLEGRLLGALDHPHIVRLVGVAELPPTDARPLAELLLALELCAGGRLPEALARRGRRPFAEAELLVALRGLADALAYVHARSIIHLDVKAENVLLAAPADLADQATSLPLLKLCDFGSALIAPLALAAAGATRGALAAAQERLDAVTTLAYRAPELVDVRAAADRGVRELGAPADVWALGCLAYRLAFSRLPFGESKLAIVGGPPALPDEPAYSPHVRALVGAMLEAAPDARPTAAALVGAIDALLG